MRLMIAVFLAVLLIIVDQAWFGGMYMSAVARALRSFFVKIGF
jgi:hypothetical protein